MAKRVPILPLTVTREVWLEVVTKVSCLLLWKRGLKYSCGDGDKRFKFLEHSKKSQGCPRPRGPQEAAVMVKVILRSPQGQTVCL